MNQARLDKIEQLVTDMTPAQQAVLFTETFVDEFNPGHAEAAQPLNRRQAGS